MSPFDRANGATNHKRDGAQKTRSVRILADETVEQILYRGFPRKLPFCYFAFLGRSLAAVYNVNERSLHVGPPLLDFAKESAKRPSVCGGTRGRREEDGGREIIGLSPLSR